MPLSLAAVCVKNAAANEAALTRHGGTDLNAIATFIGSIVPIYTYSPATPGALEVVDPVRLRQAFFRNDGAELHFLDGSPPARYLAVDPVHLEDVTRLLNEGGPAVSIKSGILLERGQTLRSRSERLRQRSQQLRLRSHAALGVRPPE
jgi:hypothetical protein